MRLDQTPGSDKVGFTTTEPTSRMAKVLQQHAATLKTNQHHGLPAQINNTRTAHGAYMPESSKRTGKGSFPMISCT
jgi:hypothetical protein